MRLKLAILGLILMAFPAGALEVSGHSAAADAANVGLLQGMQLQNKVMLAASVAALQSLANTLTALVNCQATNRFWNGTSCTAVPVYVDLANPVISWLPAVSVAPDSPTTWAFSYQAVTGNHGRTSLQKECEYDVYQRLCNCSAAANKPLVTISGNTVTIQPRSCTAYQQLGYAPCNSSAPQAYMPGSC